MDGEVKKSSAAFGIEARLILCTLRHCTKQQSLQTVGLVERFRDCQVVAQEYEKLQRYFGWGKEHFLASNLSALAASFIPNPQKQYLANCLLKGYDNSDAEKMLPVEDPEHRGMTCRGEDCSS